MKPRIAIVDYGVGNLFSVAQACAHVGLAAEITGDATRIATAAGIILPGVGAFGFAMSQLERLNIVGVIKNAVAREVPLMGVCLGFQLLFDSSEEMGAARGLGLIPGHVAPLQNAIRKTGHEDKVRSPNVSWLPVNKPQNKSNQECWRATPMQMVTEGARMYFVHSYFAEPANPDDRLAEAEYYGMKFCCAVNRGRIFGCQFHPEKSDAEGLKIYTSFARSINAAT